MAFSPQPSVSFGFILPES